MRHKDHSLYDLIHSLTTHEKGYYRQFALSTPGKAGKRSLELFHTLWEMETFDSKKLDQLLTAMGYDGQTPRLTHYLHESILDCLMYYHRKSSVNHRLHGLLQKAQILTDKGLFSQSNTILNKAMELAKHFNQPEMVLSVLRLKADNLRYGGDPSASDAIRETFNAMSAEANSYYHSIEAYRSYLSISRKLRMTGSAKTVQQLQEYREYYLGLIDHIDQSKLDTRGQINLYMCHHTYALAINEISLAISDLEEVDALLLKEIHLLEKKRHRITLNYNLINLYLGTKSFEKALKQLNTLEQWLHENQSELTPSLKKRYDRTIHLLWFIVLVKDPSHLSDKTLADKVMIFFEAKEDKLGIPERCALLFSRASYYMLTGQAAKALIEVNKLMNGNEFRDHDQSIRVEVELLNLCIHAQLNHSALLESLELRMRRWLKEDPLLPHSWLALIILDGLRKLSEVTKATERINWKSKLLEDMNENLSSSADLATSVEFDYIRYFKDVF